jgi:hypothetical protein
MHREVRELLRRIAPGRAAALPVAGFEVPNFSSALPKARGHPIASGSCGWKYGFENTLLAAAVKIQREFHAVLVDVINWQRWSLDRTLLETCVHAGISYLSTGATEACRLRCAV